MFNSQANSNLTKDIEIVVSIRRSQIGHDPSDTMYRDLLVQVSKDGSQIYSKGWFDIGQTSHTETISLRV